MRVRAARTAQPGPTGVGWSQRRARGTRRSALRGTEALDDPLVREQAIRLTVQLFSVFEMLQAGMKNVNPKLAHTLSGTIAAERRHVRFGENRIGTLIEEQPEEKPEIERMQKDMSYFVLATFADRFRDNRVLAERNRTLENASGGGAEEAWQRHDLAELSPEEKEAVLSDTVLEEFEVRLSRIGIEYQTPERP